MLFYSNCIEHPCHDQRKPHEYALAIDEGREIKGWSCNRRHYWKLEVIDGRLVRVSDELDCPLWLKKQKEKESLINHIAEQEQTFDNFDASRLSQPEILDDIKEFHHSEYKHLILMGKTGTGKTHLAKALLSSLKGKIDKLAFSISAMPLYDLFYDASRNDTARDAVTTLRSIHDYYYLFIDDLGDEKHTEREVFNSGFKRILDEFKGRIIITTNLNLEDMKSLYGEKIVSRLLWRATIKTLEAGDYRVKDFVEEERETVCQE
jgi:DNA replication protein DnaC